MDMFSGSLTYIARQLGRLSLPLLLVFAALAVIAAFAITLLAGDALAPTTTPILAAPLRW